MWKEDCKKTEYSLFSVESDDGYDVERKRMQLKLNPVFGKPLAQWAFTSTNTQNPSHHQHGDSHPCLLTNVL